MLSSHRSVKSTVTAIAAVAAMMLTSAAAHAGTILYVDDDAPLGGDGLSWGTPYRFLQDALAFACDPKNGIGEVRVGQGVYQPDRDEANPKGTCEPGPCDREATFQLCNAVALMGGYAGFGAPDPDERDIALYETILSGDLLGNDGPDFANNDENSFHVTTGSGTDDTTILDGFTITAGNDDRPYPGGRGGGMYNYRGSPTVSNSLFAANVSAFDGGAMANLGGSPVVSDCAFNGNRSAYGGGVVNDDGSSPLITACTFKNNAAEIGGGGMYNENNSSPTVVLCMFSANSALGSGPFSGGGAVHTDYRSNPIFTDCSFVDNLANVGGAMANRDGAGFGAPNPTILSCTFSGNTAFGDGGGMFNDNDSSPTVANCTFSGNLAFAGNGGAMFNGGGGPTVTNCSFSGNTAIFGAGMFNNSASPTVDRCTFLGNSGTFGGAMNNQASSPSVMGCVFTGNRAGTGAGIRNDDGSIPTVYRCVFTANIADRGGAGIYSERNCNPIVIACEFIGNSALGTDSFSGGGAVHNNFLTDPVFISCSFVGNSAVLGGAMMNRDGKGFGAPNPTIVNCTFVGNIGGMSGGGMSILGGSTEVSNCILWDNSPDEIYSEPGASPTVRYSNVQGGWSGTGNIDAGPMFVDPDNGDYRLASGSPCIDAGNNWGVPIDADDYDEDGNTAELFPVDLGGNPRFNADEADFDPGCGVPVVVDMGAYEYQFDPVEDVIFADLNADGTVGILDLLAVLAAWGDARNICLADLDIDGDVGIFDLLALLAHWG